MVFADRQECRLMGAQVYLGHPQFCGCEPSCIRDTHQFLIATAGGECVRAEVLNAEPDLIAALCGDPVRYPVVGGRMCTR